MYYDVKIVSNIFYGWKQKTLIQFCDWTIKGVVFQRQWISYFLIFLFLVCFVVLQVIVEGSWWVGFSDGAWSWLLNGNFLWVVWIMVLHVDWCKDFKEAKGWGVATSLWPSVGVKPNTWKSWRFGVLWDSRMFRVRQQGPKHLALGCFWCHWKGLET